MSDNAELMTLLRAIDGKLNMLLRQTGAVQYQGEYRPLPQGANPNTMQPLPADHPLRQQNPYMGQQMIMR